MSNSTLLGPILGFEDGNIYTVCVLLESGATDLKLSTTGLIASAKFNKVATVGTNEFWRAEIPLDPPANKTDVTYKITTAAGDLADQHGRVEWTFHVPAKGAEPRLAYASCNGFSSAKLARDTDEPYALWEKMRVEHAAQPFALLLMGGDQVYADEIWESKRCPALRRWSEKNWEDQARAKAGTVIPREAADFYSQLYLDRWKDPTMSLMLATIPSVMMWDDHDIFDGWGSYPANRQNCEVFQAVFKEAARVFDVFQLRCSKRNRLKSDAPHRTLRLAFRDYQILALDNRTDRSLTQVMSVDHWTHVKDWLSKDPNGLFGKSVPNLLVLTGVPAAYRSFASIEATMDFTVMHEELEDDVHDHWSSRPHLAERMKFIMVLLNFLGEHTGEKCKAVLLSGDVHVGALGQFWNETLKLGVTQIISSGIVHPPPTAFAWAGIQMMTSDTPEPLGDGDVVAEMLTPFGSSRYLRTRNFVSLQTGSDQKIWVNWICENAPVTPKFAIS